MLKWENGLSKPTLSQLKKLSRAFKRPLAAFLLSKPLSEPSFPKDFRLLPKSQKEKVLDKKTIIAIRRARKLQTKSLELMNNLEMDIEPKTNGFSIDDDPEKVAREIREKSGISFNEQISWDSEHTALNKWRDYIENRNIRVFQFSMPIEDARGFSLIDQKPYVIVLNSSDSVYARIFTLMHEYGHALIHEPAICIPDFDIEDGSHTYKVEKWCNHFAGTFLMPKDEFKSLIEGYSNSISSLTSLSKKLKVSKKAILVRAYVLGAISRIEYLRLAGELKPKEQVIKNSGGPPPDVKCYSEHGDEFISIVIDNLRKDTITYDEALDVLSTNLKSLEKIKRQKS